MMGLLENLSELAAGLDRYGPNGSCADLMRREYDSPPLWKHPLAFDLQQFLDSRRKYRGGGRVSLIDLITWDFEFAGRTDMAKLLNDKLAGIASRLREWEETWRDTVVEHGADIVLELRKDPKFIACGADYFGRLSNQPNYGAMEQLDETRAIVGDAAAWIRKYIETQRPKNSMPPKTDPFLGPYRPKIVRTQFNLGEKGWTDFANKYRQQGRLKNGPGRNGIETPKVVLIRQSVFTECGVIPPA